ncbi:MAG TPA: TOBE domain-containing protein, partial [Gallionella sp.]|nr:TOBE domain-containing protein [Gallionella sp.]
VDEPSRLYSFPKTRFVADFIGHINQLEAQVVESAHGHLRLEVAGLGEIIAPPLKDAAFGDKGVFAIRPEQVRIGAHGETDDLKNHFLGVVHNLLYRGEVSVYKIELANGAMLEALLPNSAPGRAELFKVGDAVRLGWRHDAGMFLRD